MTAVYVMWSECKVIFVKYIFYSKSGVAKCYKMQ